MKICILVILYDKRIEDSTTISNLLEIKSNEFSLFIVNNGPKKIEFLEKNERNNIRIKYSEFLENKPLSIVYNEFLNSCDADRYVILDDDSILSKSYINRVFDGNLNTYDLEVPRVFNKKNQIFYPLKDWTVINDEDCYLDYKANDIFSIGSGLIISRRLVSNFKALKLNLFNEAFSFYGVDFSFFWEINRHDFGKLKITSTSVIIHDMSLHGEISDFKMNELYINFALQLRHYPSMVNLKNFIYSLFQTLRSSKLKMTFAMLKAYIYARHPKC